MEVLKPWTFVGISVKLVHGASAAKQFYFLCLKHYNSLHAGHRESAFAVQCNYKFEFMVEAILNQ
jgi:hypothetical protein